VLGPLQALLRRRAELGERACVFGEGRDPVADCETSNALAKLDHLARHFQPGDERVALGVGIGAAAHHEIGVIQPGHGDADQHLALVRFGQRHLTQHVGVQTSGLLKDNGFHGRAPSVRFVNRAG
jgi:hypothetical protein